MIQKSDFLDIEKLINYLDDDYLKLLNKNEKCVLNFFSSMHDNYEKIDKIIFAEKIYDYVILTFYSNESKIDENLFLKSYASDLYRSIDFKVVCKDKRAAKYLEIFKTIKKDIDKSKTKSIDKALEFTRLFICFSNIKISNKKDNIANGFSFNIDMSKYENSLKILLSDDKKMKKEFSEYKTDIALFNLFAIYILNKISRGDL